MNITDLMANNPESYLYEPAFPLPPAMQVGIQVATVGFLAYPLVADKVKNVFGGLCSALSSLHRKTEEAYDCRVPKHVKQGVVFTGQTLFKGMICVDEMLDIANFGGTKDPQASINKSLQRLDEHNQQFAECCEFLADQAAALYLQNEGQLRDKASSWLKGKFFDFTGSFVNWLMGLSKDLLAQTVKANVLHMLANLADQGFDPQYPFGDRQRNPLGRVLSVIGVCVSSYEERFESLENALPCQQSDLRQQLFCDLSEALLAKLFPKGAEDVQLFHHTIPVKLFKEVVWKALKRQLPVLLERIYDETRPLALKHPHWKKQFEDEAQGLLASQMLTLPSSLFQHFFKGHAGSFLAEQTPSLARWLEAKEVNKAGQLSGALTKLAHELLMTQDESLCKIGTFIENYVMERILFNLSNFTPVTVDTPMPLFILQKWIEGDCFKMLRSCLSGRKESAEQAMKGALTDLLAPFGFDRLETFPLPPFIAQRAWPALQKFQKEALPRLLLKAIPKWTALSNVRGNGRNAALWLDDPALIDSCRKKASIIMDRGLGCLANPEFSRIAKLNERLPASPFSPEQEADLEDQVDALLDKDNSSLTVLSDFGSQCMEALIFQVCNDLYAHYTEACAQEGLRALFEDDAKSLESVHTDSFPVWLTSQAVKAAAGLSAAAFTDQEAEAFKRAMSLQQAIRFSKDAAQKQKDLSEFECAWGLIAQKFEPIPKRLLGILGYQLPEDLPFPKPLQKMIWDKIHSVLPKIIFEEAGWLIQPEIEKNNLKAIVEALPHGKLLSRGCTLFAQDVVDHLPEWIEGHIDKLPNLPKDQMFGLEIGKQSKETLLLHLRTFILQEDPAYDDIWMMIEGYIEGMMLKCAASLSRLSLAELQRIKALVQGAREQLIALEAVQKDADIEDQGETEGKPAGLDEVLDEQKISADHSAEQHAIAVQLADRVIQVLGICTEEDLFGIPSAFRTLLMTELKKKLAQGWLGAYRLDSKIRHHKIDEVAIEKHLPISNVAHTVLILTHYMLDQATDRLSSKEEDGQLEIIPKLVPRLNQWLGKQTDNYQIAGLFQEVIAQKIPFPFFEVLFDLLDHHHTKPYKNELADWISPFLTNHVAAAMLPLLEKEKNESPDFDQSLLLALLPIATRHLKHLRLAEQMPAGGSPSNFLEVAGVNLHPAAMQEGEDSEQKAQELFYQKQTALIFRAIFPKGKEDFMKLLPKKIIRPEQGDLLWEMAQATLSSNLPKAFDAFFERDFLTEFLNDFFEEIVEKLDQPVNLDNQKAQAEPLFKEESKELHQLDRAIGEFILEAAHFIELPFASLNKLKIMNIKIVESKLAETVGAVVRKRVDGELLPKVLLRVLHKLSKKKHVKLTRAEKVEAKRQASLDLKKWEKELAIKGFDYLIRYTAARIEKLSGSFSNPILKFLVNACLAFCSLVYIRILGSLLRLLKADQAVIGYVQRKIGNTVEKILRVFSRPSLHEDLVFSSVEAFEKVLLHE